jgi:PAS domain S-box-containing protein
MKRLQKYIEENPLLFLGHLNTGIWAIDNDSLTIYTNSVMEKMLGYAENEMLGRHLFSFMDEPGIKLCKMLLERRQQGIKEIHDFEFLRKDGARIFVSLDTSPITDKEGNYIGAIASIQDVTKQRDIEKQLCDSESKYKILFENTNSAILIADIDTGKLLDANKYAEKLLGRSRKEILGMDRLKIHPQGEPEYYERQFREHVEMGSVSFSESVVLKKDGTLVPVLISATVMEIHGKKVIQGIFQDITERKAAEEKLTRQNRNISALAETTAKFNSAGDIDEIIGILSDSTEEIGYKHSVIFERKDEWLEVKRIKGVPGGIFRKIFTSANLFREITRAPLRSENIISRTYNEQKYHKTENLKDYFIDTKAESIYLALKAFLPKTGFPVFPIGSYGVMAISNPFISTDETHFPWIQSLINQASIAIDRENEKLKKEELNTRLLQSQKMESVGQLAGGIAHDFNNLLTAIQGYAMLLADGFPEGDARSGDIREILEATKRASSLTNQLLTFSRKQITRLQDTDINGVIAGFQHMLTRLLGEDIKLSFILDPALANVRADRNQLEQVLMNLAVNSRDAMQNGGRITIKTENIALDEQQAKSIKNSLPGKYVLLTFGDTGAGMDKEVIDRAFEPFFTTKGTFGTGLGLPVVYGIVRKHEGSIDVISEKGKGTEFRIYLPVISPLPPVEDKEIPPPDAAQSKGGSILVIEDEESVRRFIVRILTKDKYAVFEAGGVKEARELFNKMKGGFDLIFSDVILPDGNGADLVCELVSLNPGLKVLVGSGYLDDKSHFSVIKERGFKFIPKPYSVDNLLATIREILAG